MAKKKLVQKAKKVKGTNAKVRVHQRKAVLKIKVNKDEDVQEKTLGYSAFPEGLPLSEVGIHVHNTRNMGDYNSLQVSVNLKDVTLANSTARKLLFNNLTDEALSLCKKLTVKTAKTLFAAKL